MTAGTTVVGGGIRAHTGSVAGRLTGGTLTNPVHTCLIQPTSMATLSTVVRIVLEVRAGTTTVGLIEGTVLLAMPIGADFIGWADIVTTSTVVVIILEIRTGAAAVGLAVGAAGTIHAGLSRRADMAATSTVTVIILEVHTGAVAVGLVGRTR